MGICTKCGAELQLGAKMLHGIPHAYTLPCSKCDKNENRT